RRKVSLGSSASICSIFSRRLMLGLVSRAQTTGLAQRDGWSRFGGSAGKGKDNAPSSGSLTGMKRSNRFNSDNPINRYSRYSCGMKFRSQEQVPMANGSKHAALRRRLRKSTGRRLLVFACLAASTLPGSSPADAQQQPVRSVPPVKVAPAKLAPAKAGSNAAVTQAIAVGEMHRHGDVVPTAGGMLGQLLGSETPSAKGPKDDGRKAYPLPPPDPSTV